MATKVKIKIADGVLKGKEQGIRLGQGLLLEDGVIIIDGHDALVFGRADDCRVCLPPDDGQVSRHHFIMEVVPPDARIRDYGSLNGTHVNGRKIGSRDKAQTPEEGQKYQHPVLNLKDGDKIKVGETLFTITIEADSVCDRCGAEIASGDRDNCKWLGDTFLCEACRQKGAALAQSGKSPLCTDCRRPIGSGKAKWGGHQGEADYCEDCWLAGHANLPPARDRLLPEPVQCKKCGKNVETELSKGCRGDYICEECRERAEDDPAELLYVMLREAGLIEAGAAKPKIPGYDIGERLGKGGYGAVYRGHDKKNDRNVAVKVMLAKVAVSPKARNDFLREIELTKSLIHPRIITLIDHGAVGAVFYFVMEYCPLGSVNALMSRKGGRLSVPEASPIMLQAIEGLAYCHSRGVIHRDLKPDNILLLEAGARLTAKVADLGLAKNFERAGLSGMTVTGQYAGTFQFMPREQLTHFRDIKPASDVWSIGATFYNMLTGQLPRDFSPAKDPGDVVLNGEIVPIRRRDASIPKGIAAVIDRALANRPEDRYENAEEMRQALTTALART